MTGAGTPESVIRVITIWKHRIGETDGEKQRKLIVKPLVEACFAWIKEQKPIASTRNRI